MNLKVTAHQKRNPKTNCNPQCYFPCNFVYSNNHIQFRSHQAKNCDFLPIRIKYEHWFAINVFEQTNTLLRLISIRRWKISGRWFSLIFLVVSVKCEITKRLKQLFMEVNWQENITPVFIADWEVTQICEINTNRMFLRWWKSIFLIGVGHFIITSSNCSQFSYSLPATPFFLCLFVCLFRSQSDTQSSVSIIFSFMSWIWLCEMIWENGRKMLRW